MAAKNSFNTGVLYTDRRDFYIEPGVVNELYQDITPFTTLLGQLGTVSINDPVFKLFEYRNAWLDQYVIANNDDGTNVVADPAIPDVGTQVAIKCSKATPGLGRNSSGAVSWNARELASPTFDNSAIGLILQLKSEDKVASFRVDSASGSQLTCTVLSNIGNLAAIADNAKLNVIGTSFEEGGVAPDASSDDISVIWGRTQISKTSIEVTGTLYNMALRGYSNELARLRQEKMKEFKIQQERSFLLGVDPKKLTYSGALAQEDGSIRYSQGVIPSLMNYGTDYSVTSNSSNIKANKFNFTNATTYSAFVDMMENLFSYIPSSSDSRILFCGSGVLSFFSKPDTNGIFKIGSASNPFTMSDPIRSEFGFDVRKLRTPHGEINLVHAPILRGDWRNYGVIIDTDNVRKYSFRPLVYQTDIKKDNAYDGVKDQIMSDEGVGLSMIEKHALIKVTP